MPTPLSQTKIVNAAASELGSTERLSSINDVGTLASHAQAHWDFTIEVLVAEHPWNFAVARKQLPLSAIPDFGFSHAYALPSDCARFLPPLRGRDYYACELEGGLILTDRAAPLPVRYISNAAIGDTTRWPAYFANAVKFALAAAMAEAMTGSQQIKRDMEAKAADALAKAKRRDGRESGGRPQAQAHTRSSWLRGSFGYRHSYDDPYERQEWVPE